MRKDHYTLLARKAVKTALQGLSGDAPVGFGCSGGADSAALLFALSTLYKKERAGLVHVVIVDHQLQSITSEISQRTAELAGSFGFNAHIIPVDIVPTKEGMESDARKSRYNAFETVIQEEKLEAFLIGHTKTDQAEQVFLGMLRGSGTKSMSGIPYRRGVFVRPFLNDLSREDTQKVCEENNYDYWCDPHNDSTDYRRVIVRKMISGIEKETGQGIVDSLVRTSQINAEDSEALDFYADSAYKSIEDAGWEIEELLKLPLAVRKRLYRRKMIEMGAITEDIGFNIINRVEEFLTNWKGQKALYASNGVRVERKNGFLNFYIAL